MVRRTAIVAPAHNQPAAVLVVEGPHGVNRLRSPSTCGRTPATRAVSARRLLRGLRLAIHVAPNRAGHGPYLRPFACDRIRPAGVADQALRGVPRRGLQYGRRVDRSTRRMLGSAKIAPVRRARASEPESAVNRRSRIACPSHGDGRGAGRPVCFASAGPQARDAALAVLEYGYDCGEATLPARCANQRS